MTPLGKEIGHSSQWIILLSSHYLIFEPVLESGRVSGANQEEATRREEVSVPPWEHFIQYGIGEEDGLARSIGTNQSKRLVSVLQVELVKGLIVDSHRCHLASGEYRRNIGELVLGSGQERIEELAGRSLMMLHSIQSTTSNHSSQTNHTDSQLRQFDTMTKDFQFRVKSTRK